MALVNNQAALNTVYNYYLTAYAPTTNNTSRYDTHKKSELKNVYSSIVKQNKESPSYIIDTSRDTQAFAVGMKEGARQFSNTISSLSSDEDGDALSRKVASSSDNSIVSAKFIGNPTAIDPDLSFDISVEQLATTQINEGTYLNSDDEVDLEPNTYSFDISVNDTDYEFQFNIAEGDTNIDLQKKLEALINRSNIGISASVNEDGEGNSALVLESSATGISEDKDSLFSVSDDRTSKTSGAVDYLGISNISRPATNASFTLNGLSRSAFSNTFTVDKQFEVNLKGVSGEDNSVSIGLKPDIDSMTDNINQLVDSYNAFIDKANAYTGSKVKTDTLLSDIRRTTSEYQSKLENLGLSFDEDRKINVDEDVLKESLSADDGEDNRSAIKGFTSALTRKLGQISLNPMNYVQKTMVAYKNPGKSYPNPYVTSIYSGMMFNSYC